MTAIDRTAYPRPGSRLTREELNVPDIHLTETDLSFVQPVCPWRDRTSDACDTAQSAPATWATSRRRTTIHASTLRGTWPQQLADWMCPRSGLTQSRIRPNRCIAIRRRFEAYLSVTHYDDVAERIAFSRKSFAETAETMSDPADLINQAAIETLQAAAIDLPAFSTLDRLVNRLRAEVHARIYNRVLHAA